MAVCVAVLLSLPSFRYSYLFDDFNFLGTAQVFRLGALLPDPESLFYRPVSRELYFKVLTDLSPGKPLLGHVLNAALLASIVRLIYLLVARLAGQRAGLISALALACFAPWPVLVGWVCGSQDLLAIMFTLAALLLILKGRRLGSLVAFGLALLSKETAVAAIPALIMIDWIRSGSVARSVRTGGLLIALTLVWAAFHPGIRELLGRYGAGPEGSYIGLDNSDRWANLMHSVPALLNLPLTGFPTPWPSEFAVSGLLGLAGLTAFLYALSRTGKESDPENRLESQQLTIYLGLVFALPAVLLTGLIVHHWAPYYVCFPAVGLCISAGALLSELRQRALVGFLSLYFLLGFWSRGIELHPGLPTERSLAVAGNALVRLEENFKKVAPTLPSPAIVYVSTMATGSQSIYVHLHGFQALRIWYGDPSLQTLRPELRVASGSAEELFCVGPSLEVYRIKMEPIRVQSSRGEIDPRRLRSTLLSYAIGLSGSGEIGRAVDLLLNLSKPNSWYHVVDRRIAAMLLFSHGDEIGAMRLLRGLPDLPPATRLECVGSMLTVPTRARFLDQSALRAFEVSGQDTGSFRLLMERMKVLGYFDPAERLAHRILALRPGDMDARRALQEIDRARTTEGHRIMSPIRTIGF